MTEVAERSVTVADLIAVLREQQHRPPAPTAGGSCPIRSEVRTFGSPLMVVAAHGGAGATTMAIALTDALSSRDGAERSVELVDGAPPDASGLVAAAERAVSGPNADWVAGRRGSTTILRPAAASALPGQWPPLEPQTVATVVIDAGWPLQLLQANASPVGSLLPNAQVLLVCRATVPGVRRAELALRTLPGQPVVALVGARRLPKAVTASMGSETGTALAQGRVVLIPKDRHLEVNGIDARPLPAGVVAAASHLVELIWPGTAGVSARPRRRVEPR